MKGLIMMTLCRQIYWVGTNAALLAAGVVLAGSTSGASGQEVGGKALTETELVHEIFNTMVQVPGTKTGYRVAHAKGIVCQGTFTPSKDAPTLSRAAHFQGGSVPVTVRFSDGAPDPVVPDNSPNAGPRGMAIRFKLPGGDETDLVVQSHNGFAVSTGEEFLALQKAVVATDPTKPHPWPIEGFLATHPSAMKFVVENRVVPASFATVAFFSSDAFIFVSKDGVKEAGRYQIIPSAGQHNLSDEEAKTKAANFLADDLRTRLSAGPIDYHLVVQLAHVGDPTKDPSIVWPEDRKTIDIGIISITSVVAGSSAAEKELAFDPTDLTDGIELSDDPFPRLRSKVYSLAVSYRQ
jgi:catalase